MFSLRLVLDTNAVVSAALRPDGLQRTVFLLAISKPVRWYLSSTVYEEYQMVLSRPELRIRKGLRQQLLQLIRKHTHVVFPSRSVRVTSDPGDDIFLECAEAARADYLNTGNLRHFPTYWKSTKVVTSREFLTVAAPHLLR
jgi:putative PIN family toxin of toxin-antitoxin system